MPKAEKAPLCKDTMVGLLRLVALSSLALVGVTAVRPRTGWGRLALFIPKLFAGTHILYGGALGLAAAIPWLAFRDTWTAIMGLGAAALAGRHVYRIARRSLKVEQDILDTRPPSSGRVPAGRGQLPWMTARQEPRGTRWRRDIVIGRRGEGGEPLLADLWWPSVPARRSGLGIVYLHGSGWHYASKDFGTRPFFRHLAGQGHTILDVAYTLAPRADLCNMVGDVKRAIGWTKAHAQELGIRADRIVLMGGSAGGHLALLAAYSTGHPVLDFPEMGDTSVCGVVSYYGPTDLRAQYERFEELPGLTGRTGIERKFMTYLEARFGFVVLPVHRLLPSLLGGTPSEVPELYDLGSPITHVGHHCPPTLLLQGTHDFSGAAPQARKLYDLLRDARCTCFLLELPETEHGFDLYKPRRSPAAWAATHVTERFLEALI